MEVAIFHPMFHEFPSEVPVPCFLPGTGLLSRPWDWEEGKWHNFDVKFWSWLKQVDVKPILGMVLSYLFMISPDITSVHSMSSLRWMWRLCTLTSRFCLWINFACVNPPRRLLREESWRLRGIPPLGKGVPSFAKDGRPFEGLYAVPYRLNQPHLKNMLVKFGIISPMFGMKRKNIWVATPNYSL